MSKYPESTDPKLASDSGASTPPPSTPDGDVTPAFPSQVHTAAPRQKAPRSKKAKKPRSADKLGSQGAPDGKDQQPSEPGAIKDLNLAFNEGLADQMMRMAIRDDKLDETKTDFITAVIVGIAPKDPLEKLLALQIAAVHGAAMSFAARLNNSHDLNQLDTYQNGLNKFARTFTTQMDALKRYRSGHEQTINVQNVSVSDGGQAIVGNVNAQPAPIKTSGPPPVLTDAKTAAIPIIQDNDNDRSAVPVTPPSKEKK
jgi:hypothetical protein